jgi:hypothetical protein
MNQRGVFIPSDQLRSTSAPSKAVPAEKAAAEPVVDPSTLSEAEVAFNAKMADDKTVGGAMLWLNGELMAVGNRWLPGMKEKWERGGNLVVA